LETAQSFAEEFDGTIQVPSVLWWLGYYDYAPGQFGRGRPRYGGYGSDSSTKIAVPPNAPKRDASSFVQPDDKSKILTTTPTVPTKTEIPQPSQLNDEVKKTEIPPSSQLDDESVIKKAKATIAAKMSDSNSVEFEKVERAVSKNVLGNSIDTICGYVSDKNNGSKLFLYIVQKDEAYIGAYAIATTEYRNVCSITTLGR
jgi:hypothetical protein